MSTPFQLRVYAACREIPRGRVTTYADLARRIGCRSPRAVGQALRHNPDAPRTPCHRVVASDRALGGFNGARAGEELERKRQLLLAEGVCLEPDGRVAPACLWAGTGHRGDSPGRSG
jgi:methylated-DNA-[protein]-cysteine S-methyltransferase